MNFNDKEREILELVHNNNVDIEKINNLFKEGANANASNGIVEDEYIGNLFSECIFEALPNDINIFELLKCFVQNGLDLDKYGNSIIGDLHATFVNNDIIEIVKYILDNVSKKINVEYAIEMFRLEAEYLSDDFSIYDEKANLVDTVAFMLEEYMYGGHYKEVYDYSKIIGQEILEVTVDNSVSTSTKDYLMIDLKTKDINTIIKCSNDVLCVSNSTTAYINNNYKKSYSVDNSFIKQLNETIKGEKIEKIEFEHTFERMTFKSFKSSRNIKLYFSNNKELFYKMLTPNKMFMRLVDLKESNKLNKFETVFLEQCENFLDQDYCVIPNKEARYKIGHNCNITKDNMMSFVLVEKENEKEYISIDNSSLQILLPYFSKHINNFENNKKCIMLPKDFLNIKKDLELLIEKLKNDEDEDPLYLECIRNFNYFTLEDYINADSDEYEYKDFNFPYVKEEIIEFIKAFIWYFNDYKSYGNRLDEKVVNIFKY